MNKSQKLIAQTASNRVLLRPAPQLRVVVASAELDQARAALKVAFCILERVRLALRFIEDDAVGVVVVGVDFRAVAVGQADDRALPIEEVVILASAGQAFVEEQAAATAGE